MKEKFPEKSSIELEIDLISDARILVEIVRDLIPTKIDGNVLAIMFIPFFSFLTVIRNDQRLMTIAERHGFPKNLDDLIHRIYGHECLGDTRPFSIKLSEMSSLHLGYRPNWLESLFYKLFLLNYKVIKYNYFPKETITDDVQQRNFSLLRNELYKKVGQKFKGINFSKLVPISLFEKLHSFDATALPTMFPDLIWIGPFTNETYLFFLGSAKVKGSVCYSEPHGGGYFQLDTPTPYEICERTLADYYGQPSWSGDPGHVNIRASRNVYICFRENIKRFITLRRKPLRKNLVILPFFFIKTEQLLNCTNYYLRVLRALVPQISGETDFRIYPRQDLNELREFLNERGLSINLVEADSLLLSTALNYERIIVLEAFSTAVIELAQTNLEILIFVGHENSGNPIKLAQGYRRFLERTSLDSKKLVSRYGKFLSISNASFRNAFGGKLNYFLYYIGLFRFLARKRVNRTF